MSSSPCSSRHGTRRRPSRRQHNFCPRRRSQPSTSAMMPPGSRPTSPSSTARDPEIEQVYYYRWKVYKSHLKDLGDRGYIVTEFLDDVPWAKQPYQSLNDATAFHIHEGRWLRDPRYVNDYVDYMYTGGGNDRHFSEAIADAVYADYLATGGPHRRHEASGHDAVPVSRLGRPLRLFQEPVLHRAAAGCHRVHHLLDRCDGRAGRLHRRERLPALDQQLHVRGRTRHQQALRPGRRPEHRQGRQGVRRSGRCPPRNGGEGPVERRLPALHGPLSGEQPERPLLGLHPGPRTRRVHALVLRSPRCRPEVQRRLASPAVPRRIGRSLRHPHRGAVLPILHEAVPVRQADRSAGVPVERTLLRRSRRLWLWAAWRIC